jgi:RNA polymerase sigma-70 factor (ECF subfamily)
MTIKEFEQITIKALKEGSVDAFDLCFKRFYAPLIAFARSKMSNIDIAEEIVQNVFAELWERRDSIPLKTEIKQYLFAIVKNDCYDFARHQKVEQKYLDYLTKHQEEGYEFFDTLVDEDFQKLINEVYNSLPEQCRTIFYMSRLEEMSYKAIAEKLEISVKTVENQVGKALKLVRQYMDKAM